MLILLIADSAVSFVGVCYCLNFVALIDAILCRRFLCQIESWRRQLSRWIWTGRRARKWCRWGWIPLQDVDAIVQQRGPDGTLYFSRLMETTSLMRTMLDDLIQRRWVRVHLSDEDFQIFETRSNASSSTSMRDEIEVLCEQNRMLRDAMQDQTRVQEEVLSRLVDEMAGRQRPEAATLPSSGVVCPGRSTGGEDLFAGRPSLATAGLDMGNESLMWDDMEQPRPSAAQRRLTNPFLTPLEVHPLLDESLSNDGYVPQGFTRMGLLLNSRSNRVLEWWEMWPR